MDKKVVIITGGSEGLGKEIAKLLSSTHQVVILARNEEKLKFTSSEIGCDYVVCDVSSFQSVEKAVISIKEKYGKIDVLVNNAGLLIEGSIEENSYEDITSVVNVNVLGYMYMVKAVIPYMKEVRGGRIINISSQSGLYHRHKRAVYNPNKWAITGFTKCLQVDLSPYNINVTGIYPGKINTGMFKKAGNTSDMSDSLDPVKVAKSVKFVVESSDDVVISELGMKNITQTTTETICY